MEQSENPDEGLEADVKARIPGSMKREFEELLKERRKKNAALKLSDLYREAFSKYLSAHRKSDK